MSASVARGLARLGKRGGKEAAMSDTGYGDFEFERRFVARDVAANLLEATPTLIVQSYLLSDEGYAVRVRAQAPGVPAQVDPALDELGLLEAYVTEVDF